jgi:RimJ/RimL family protein N-acetyltransferase
MPPELCPREIVSRRLRLRRWRKADLGPYAAINADSRVTEFLRKPLTLDETKGLIQWKEEAFLRDGFGFWAVELLESREMIGMVGLGRPGFAAPFTPCVEIGWRISANHWGKGYAPEAARKVLDLAFGPLGISEIVSFTAATNLRSRRVMEKI